MKNFDPTLLSFLQKHSIAFDYYEHRPIFTVEEGEDIKHTIPGMHTKNLFLTDKRDQYFLVCIESSKRLAINMFRKLIGVKDLSFGTPEEMMEVLGLTPGSVSLFGLCPTPNPSPSSLGRSSGEGKVKLNLYLDKDLWEAEKVGWHPNRNDATIVLLHDQIEKFLDAINKKPTLIEVGDGIVQLESAL